MKRLPLLLAALAAVVALGLLSSIVTQGFGELAAARAEKAQLEEDRQRLQNHIEDLQITAEALATDDEAVESAAREELGWIKPGEEVIVLATPTPPPPLDDLTDEGSEPILRLP